MSLTTDKDRNELRTDHPEVDFKLSVNRILTQAGNYIVDMQWMHVVGQLGYNVYRAETRSDDPKDWYKINTKLICVNYYQDRGFTGDPINNGRIQWWYKVVPVNQDGEEFALSRSISATFEIPLNGIQRWVAPTIRMRTAMQLDPAGFSAAEVVHFLVRMWAGAYCTCLDVRTRKVDANCAMCYGTGYKGGYNLIENVYCRIRSTPVQMGARSGGITITHNPTGVIASYPILTDGDVIVRKHNERFRIRRPKHRKIQNYITAQSFELDKIQLYDMAYRWSTPPIVEPTSRREHNVVPFGMRSEYPSVNRGRGGSGLQAGIRNTLR